MCVTDEILHANIHPNFGSHYREGTSAFQKATKKGELAKHTDFDDELPWLVDSPSAGRCPLNEPGHWDIMISYTQRNADAKLMASELFHSFEELGRRVWLDVKMGQLNEQAMQEAREAARMRRDRKSRRRLRCRGMRRIGMRSGKRRWHQTVDVAHARTCVQRL